MKKFVPLFLFLAVVLVNAFMVYSLKHDRLPFLNTKSVEAMAWEEMINPNWSAMRIFNADCYCASGGDSGETLQCSYFAPTDKEPCGDSQHGLDRCYEFGQMGIESLCETFYWWDPFEITIENPDGVLYYHP